MTLLDVALDCVHRGWYVFPCVPRTKRPLGGLVPQGVLDASKDVEHDSQMVDGQAGRECCNCMWSSGLSVVDCDHGNGTEADARAWMRRTTLPETYTVHTGRRVNAKGRHTGVRSPALLREHHAKRW